MLSELIYCLLQICFCFTASFDDKSVPDILINLMSRDKTTEMQLASAKWYILILFPVFEI